jgi:hypothetical protein
MRKRAATNFKLDSFQDSFISSCLVHVRKPDASPSACAGHGEPGT